MIESVEIRCRVTLHPLADPMNIRRLCSLPAVLGLLMGAAASPGRADPVVYHYDGDTLPTEGAYGAWFTTIGAGFNGYFPATSWSSDGDVLTMNTVYPGSGIWFGRTELGGDPSVGFDLAGTGDGNIVTMRAALSAGATDWSLYFYDADGYGSDFELRADGVTFAYVAAGTSDAVTDFHAIADMTVFHTYTSYVLGGQVSYFVDGQYLGGGASFTNGTTNFLLVGDSSGSTPTGTGSFYLDYLTVTTAALSYPAASPVPEPAATAAWLGVVLVGWSGCRRPARRRS